MHGHSVGIAWARRGHLDFSGKNLVLIVDVRWHCVTRRVLERQESFDQTGIAMHQRLSEAIMRNPQSVLLTHWRSPGDIVCLTAAVRDLATNYPGRFAIHVGGSCSDLWEHNPHVVGVWGARLPRNLPMIRVSYTSQLSLANDLRLHFLTAFHRAIADQLGIPIPVLHPHGDLHLSADEKATPPVPRRYWFFVAGGKADIVTKIWPTEFSQRLVSLLVSNGVSVVQGGATFPGHRHPVLAGVESLVGKTSLRDVLRLIYHAEGVICPVTFAMHVAAAFHKPCVVIAGGREPWSWGSYSNSPDRHFGEECSTVRVPHRFLHTQGTLDCCRDGGCWKTQLIANPPWDKHDCVRPVTVSGGGLSPECLATITPDIVVDAVMSYYRDGTLWPL